VNRFILALALALAAAPSVALAQQPTPAQIEKAKAAFGEGKKLFEQGDFMEAAAKFKESYNLSKNAVLLYNIGFANEKAGQDDVALFYYRKFLSDAPADAAQRPEVTERVKELEKKFQTGPTTTTPTTTTPTETTEHHESEPAKPLKIKPAGTYSEADVQHQIVDTAPPKKPLDITAFVPEDSGFEVTLYYRTAGEGKFTAKPMKWHYKQLIARVPPEKMIGESLQYYIEAKDATGAVVARKGKSTSPNLVTLEPNAPVRYFPDFTDDTAGSSESTETVHAGRDEDPLHPHQQNDDHNDVVGPVTPITGGGGITDPSSKKFTYMKWGSTATAVAMLGVSVGFYLRAGSFADALESDCPPNSGCQVTWDSYAQSTYDSGKTAQTISRVTGVIGIGAAVVAGVWWYKSLKGHHATKESAPKATEPKHDEMAWQVTPVLPASRDGFTGAAASIEF
jgi:hypothetical protein